MHLRNPENLKKMKHKNFTLGGVCPGFLSWRFLSGGFLSGDTCPGGFVPEPIRPVAALTVERAANTLHRIPHCTSKLLPTKPPC